MSETEFYCSNCGHTWKIPHKNWVMLARVKVAKMPKCPKCGYYEEPAIVGKEK